MFYPLHGLSVPRVRYYQSVENAYLETNQSAGNNNGYCQILSGRAVGLGRPFRPVLIASQSDLPPQSITDAQQPIILDATPTGSKTIVVPPLVKPSIQVQQDYADSTLYDARVLTPRPLNPGSRDRCPPVYINNLLETLVLDVTPTVNFWITPRGAIWSPRPTTYNQAETPIEVLQPVIAIRGAPFVNVAPQAVKIYSQVEYDYGYILPSVSKVNVLNIPAPSPPLVNDRVNVEYLYSTPCFSIAAPPYVVTIPKQPLLSLVPPVGQPDLEIGTANFSRLTPEPPRGSGLWYIRPQMPMQDGLEDGRQVSVQRGAIANPVQSRITVSIGGGQPDSYEVIQPWIICQKAGGDRPYAQPIIQKTMSDYEQISIYTPPATFIRNPAAPLPDIYTLVMSVSQQTVTDFNPAWSGYSLIVNTTGVFTAPKNPPEILDSSPCTPTVTIKGRG